MNKIKDKIEEMEEYLADLTEIAPSDFKAYSTNKEKRAACERYFQKIVEAVIDLSFTIAKEKGWKIAESEEEALRVLEDNKLIKNDLYLRLKEAKGMRNFIVHQYDKIDDLRVFEAIANELHRDIREFLKNAREKYEI